MKPWNLESTKLAVLGMHGDSQADRLWESLQSIHKRKYIAGYHFLEYKRLLKDHLDPKLAVQHPLEILLDVSSADKRSIQELHLQVIAHVLACMQSMHAIADTLAFAVAYALGLNLGVNRLSDSKISLDSVIERLQREPTLQPVATALLSIKSNSDFKQLSDVVNYSKHRSVIAVNLHFDATGESENKYELRLPSFEFKSRKYAQREVATFLEPLYAWLNPEILKCGHALNTAIGASAA